VSTRRQSLGTHRREASTNRRARKVGWVLRKYLYCPQVHGLRVKKFGRGVSTQPPPSSGDTLSERDSSRPKGKKNRFQRGTGLALSPFCSQLDWPRATPRLAKAATFARVSPLPSPSDTLQFLRLSLFRAPFWRELRASLSGRLSGDSQLVTGPRSSLSGTTGRRRKSGAGTSNFVRPLDNTGLSKGCGATRRGASKLFTIFRSPPVSSNAVCTWAGMAG
jgi:hypothetical protein